MSGFLADIRHALRLYRVTPGSSAIVVIVVAVAIAFVTAFLSLYVDLFLKPYPGFEAGGRFVTLAQTDGERRQGFPFGLIERAADEMSSLDAVAGVFETRQSTGNGTDARPAVERSGVLAALRARDADAGRRHGRRPADAVVYARGFRAKERRRVDAGRRHRARSPTSYRAMWRRPL